MFFQNKEIEKLDKELQDLIQKREELKPQQNLIKLTVENDKLKYRINILETVRGSLLLTTKILEKKFK